MVEKRSQSVTEMFIPVQCSYSAIAETDSVVKTGGLGETAVDLGFHAHLPTFPPPVATLAVADALLLNGTAAYALSPAPLFAMGDIFSLSVLQILSVLSFLTSVLAVVCVGSGSLYRFSHKIEADVNQPPSEMNVAGAKVPLWNWSASFSLGSLIGDDDDEEVGGTPGYTGGSDLVRMDWHVSRPVRGTCLVSTGRVHPLSMPSSSVLQPQPPLAQPPVSMAKLIMSRHVSVVFPAALTPCSPQALH